MTKEAILIKAGRFTRPAGPEAEVARDDWGQSGDRKNDSCQAGGVERSPWRDGQENQGGQSKAVQ